LFNFASYYEHGEGIRRDLKKSKMYYQLAADSGDQYAVEKMQSWQN
jgi:TPR repeat protein